MKKILLIAVAGILFSVLSSYGQNPRLNLLEDQTFTSCGCCPCLDSIVRTCILPRVPNSVFVRYHFNMSGLYSENCDSLMDALTANQRKLSVNRNGMFFFEPQYAHDLYQLCDSVVKVLKADTIAPVKLEVKSKIYQPATRKLDVNVDFTPYEHDLSGTFMVNLVITENKILFDQSFHDSCGKPLGIDYKILHYNAVRQMAYYLYADQLKQGTWPVSNTINRTFSLTLDPRWVAENCDYTVYIYKKEDSICRSKIEQAYRGPVTWPLAVESVSEPMTILKIIPNPAADQINCHVRFNSDGIAEFSIIDQNGRVMEKLPPAMIENQVYNYDVNVSHYESGTYFLMVKSGDIVRTEKFVVFRK